MVCFLKQKEEEKEAQASVPAMPSADEEKGRGGDQGRDRSGKLSRMAGPAPLVWAEWFGGEKWYSGFRGKGEGKEKGHVKKERPRPVHGQKDQREHLEKQLEQDWLPLGLSPRSPGLHYFPPLIHF